MVTVGGKGASMQLDDIERRAEFDHGDLSRFEIAALRTERTDLEEAEAQVSLLRRSLLARIDLIEATLEVRRNGDDATERLDALLATLPDLMAPRRSTRSPRSPRHRRAVEPDAELFAVIDAAEAISMFAIVEAGIDELDVEYERLSALERRVSTVRGRLHRILDAIQADIARRYRTGELSATA